MTPYRPARARRRAMGKSVMNVQDGVGVAA
jgi:hypothetical protein